MRGAVAISKAVGVTRPLVSRSAVIDETTPAARAILSDEKGRPVGATAVLAEQVESAIEADLAAGGDLSEAVVDLPANNPKGRA